MPTDLLEIDYWCRETVQVVEELSEYGKTAGIYIGRDRYRKLRDMCISIPELLRQIDDIVISDSTANDAWDRLNRIHKLLFVIGGEDST